MKYEYRRDLNRTLLILPGKEQNGMHFQEQMLERNKIEGLLPCQICHVDSNRQYCYDISSRQPLSHLYAVRKMRYKEYVRLVYKIQAVMQETEKYLLDSSRLLLNAELVFLDLTMDKVWMIYYPGEPAEEDHLFRAGEDLLELIDYSDDKMVDAAHRFYELSRAENFSWSSVIRDCEEREAGHYETAAEQIEISTDDSCGRGHGIKQQEAEKENKIVQDTGLLQDTGLFQNTVPPEDTGLLLLSVRLAAKVAAAVAILSASAFYIWRQFILTAAEMTIGAFLYAAAVLGLFLYARSCLIRQRGYEEGRGREEKPEKLRKRKLKIETSETKQSEKPHQETTGESREGYAEAAAGGEEPQEYGETVCLAVLEEEEERRLEGRVRGKETMIFLDTMPFLVGKLKDRVSCCIQDASVSRIHAVFKEEDGRIVLSDLQSRNGTFKNEIRLEAGEALPVRPGDEIRFGKVRFIYY